MRRCRPAADTERMRRLVLFAAILLSACVPTESVAASATARPASSALSLIHI